MVKQMLPLSSHSKFLKWLKLLLPNFLKQPVRVCKKSSSVSVDSGFTWRLKSWLKRIKICGLFHQSLRVRAYQIDHFLIKKTNTIECALLFKKIYLYSKAWKRHRSLCQKQIQAWSDSFLNLLLPFLRYLLMFSYYLSLFHDFEKW